MRLHDLFEIGGKVTRVAGDNLELDGGAVKIDLKKFDIDMEDPNKPKLKKKKHTSDKISLTTLSERHRLNLLFDFLIDRAFVLLISLILKLGKIN